MATLKYMLITNTIFVINMLMIALMATLKYMLITNTIFVINVYVNDCVNVYINDRC